MKKLLTLFTSALCCVSSNFALAHPGHQVDGMIGQAGHAFTSVDYFLGALLVSVVIYQIIRRQNK
jgi:hypothetical protein